MKKKPQRKQLQQRKTRKKRHEFRSHGAAERAVEQLRLEVGRAQLERDRQHLNFQEADRAATAIEAYAERQLCVASAVCFDVGRTLEELRTAYTAGPVSVPVQERQSAE